jgi:hypothetical protein
MKRSLAAEVELSRDSVLGIMDFRYAPYALGDTFTWLTNLQIVAHNSGRQHIDIVLITLPEMPSSRLQRQITTYNYIQSVEGLFPAFLCCPKVRSIRVYEKFRSSAQRVLAAMIARSGTWPSLVSHFRKDLDYSTHRQINAFYKEHGWIPRLRPPAGFGAETKEFRAKHLAGRVPFVVNIRQRMLTADPAALHRDSASAVWRRFFAAVERSHPSAVFLLAGGVSEWERPTARLSNVVIPRMHGYGLGHELTLLLEGTPFIGSSSGFSAAATFSEKTPYLITNFEHQASAYVGMPVGEARYPFAVGQQSLSWVPETDNILFSYFERVFNASRGMETTA